MAYEDYKDLPRRSASDKILLDKAFNIVKKSASGGGFENMPNEKLAKELHKPTIRDY